MSRDFIMSKPIRLVALISGGGTTLQNLIDRIALGRLNATIAGVVSSRADALGIERAKKAGVPVEVAASRSTRFADEVWLAVRAFAPDLVCFAGWLRLLPIPADFRHRVLNIHPALLPAFGGKGMYGRHVHEAVLASGAKVSGCTVHFADDTYDTGPMLVQKCVPVMEGDDAESLAARVFAAECEAYPEAIALLASGRVKVEGRRAVISG
jgi:phosphoribosylglycinamide formyltransferase-1